MLIKPVHHFPVLYTFCTSVMCRVNTAVGRVVMAASHAVLSWSLSLGITMYTKLRGLIGHVHIDYLWHTIC